MSQADVFSPGDSLRTVDILYVDGEHHRRDGMRRILESLGARRVQLADSAETALQVFLGAQVDLVLTELELPKQDGVTLVRRIRDVANYPKALVPALVMSDPVGPEVVRSALQAGANHFLVKPLSPAKLYERLEWALKDSRPFGVFDGHYVIKRTPAGKQRPSASA